MEKTPLHQKGLAYLGIGVVAASLLLLVGGYLTKASFEGGVFAINQEKKASNVFDYIQIVDSCGPHYEGVCAVARGAPATTSPALARLRAGMVLEVASATVKANDHVWYKIIFNETLRYPERVTDDWYVAADSVKHFTEVRNEDVIPGSSTASTTKRIIVSRSKQTLTAYDGKTVFMETAVSTGLDLTPTPRGTFTVYRKTPSRYMQGPLPGISDQYYDLPGVPWDLYFTAEGGAIHGAYWHNEFGQQWSHGCVNLPLDDARALYEWAPIGTKVIVED